MRCAMARTREKRIPKYHLFWNGTKWICDWLTEWPRWMGQWRLTITTSSRKQHTFIANTKQFHLISMLNSVIFPVWLWLGSARLGGRAIFFFFFCSARIVWIKPVFELSGWVFDCAGFFRFLHCGWITGAASWTRREWKNKGHLLFFYLASVHTFSRHIVWWCLRKLLFAWHVIGQPSVCHRFDDHRNGILNVRGKELCDLEAANGINPMV